MSHSNAILTAIVQGMRKEEQNLHVKLAATNAMLDTLEFSKDNFDQEVHLQLTLSIQYISNVDCTPVEKPSMHLAQLFCIL